MSGGRLRTRLARGKPRVPPTSSSMLVSSIVVVLLLLLLIVIVPFTSAQTIPEDTTNSPDPSTSAASPKELFPGILDPGSHPNYTLRFGVLMPLNLTKPEDAYWKTLVMHTVTVRKHTGAEEKNYMFKAPSPLALPCVFVNIGHTIGSGRHQRRKDVTR